MNQKLTIKTVNALKPKERYYDVWDTDIAGFFVRVYPSGTHTFFLFYRNSKNEKRTYKIGRGLTAIQARDIASKEYAKVASGLDIQQQGKTIKAKAEKDKSTTLKSFSETIYKPWLTENRKSGANAFDRISHSFIDLADKQLDQITPWDLELWRKKRKAAGTGDHTLKRDLAELKTMLSRAKQWSFITTNQIYDFKYGRLDDNRIDRNLTGNERTRLYAALDSREEELIAKRKSGNQWRSERGYESLDDYKSASFVDYLKPLVILALNTGLRRGELLNLKWDDVKLSNSKITVVSTNAKSKRARHVPLNIEALKTLTDWKSQNTTDHVFTGKSGQPMKDIKKSWASLIQRAKIEQFRFHDLRHDFASQLVIKGVDLYVVKELLGHSTIQVTERYAHLAPKQLEDAVNLLNEK